MYDLLCAVRDRLSLLPEFENTIITVAFNARFDSLPEGCVQVCVVPNSQLREHDARDVVKETTTIAVCVAEYFANPFREAVVDKLLGYLPKIEEALFDYDVKLQDALYHWESTQALGMPFDNTVKDIPGGVLDVDAADENYVYQVPLMVTYARFLKMVPIPSVVIKDSPIETPFTIHAPESMRMTTKIISQDGDDITGILYRYKQLTFE